MIVWVSCFKCFNSSTDFYPCRVRTFLYSNVPKKAGVFTRSSELIVYIYIFDFYIFWPVSKTHNVMIPVLCYHLVLYKIELSSNLFTVGCNCINLFIFSMTNWAIIVLSKMTLKNVDFLHEVLNISTAKLVLPVISCSKHN